VTSIRISQSLEGLVPYDCEVVKILQIFDLLPLGMYDLERVTRFLGRNLSSGFRRVLLRDRRSPLWFSDLTSLKGLPLPFYS